MPVGRWYGLFSSATKMLIKLPGSVEHSGNRGRKDDFVYKKEEDPFWKEGNLLAGYPRKSGGIEPHGPGPAAWRYDLSAMTRGENSLKTDTNDSDWVHYGEMRTSGRKID
ncbi:hypothetical protein PIIN_03113 [Serendipita indica DSM 11827]|uniref:Uncharacterized protein n=1 Tax=Serendipita indica (strain DSM 11827) TaxID=1109443 RepID=G4TD20_SERID|nr:hypothetical protein PIIN_03113 [Serendipita indica DSM 11827]